MNIRPITAADRPGICALDTSFETATVFDVTATPHRLDLVERPITPPLVKRYAIADAFAVEFESWHARLVLWHLYVSPERRREGIGRALLERPRPTASS